jgi:hypothetical protein
MLFSIISPISVRILQINEQNGVPFSYGRFRKPTKDAS